MHLTYTAVQIPSRKKNAQQQQQPERKFAHMTSNKHTFDMFTLFTPIYRHQLPGFVRYVMVEQGEKLRTW